MPRLAGAVLLPALALLGYYQGEIPPHGAIWLTLYPNIMIEWYPHVLVVSTLYPRGPQSTTNVVEFYYSEDVVLFEREFVEAEQAAYWETAIEDDEIALRMDRGRRALMQQGISQVGDAVSQLDQVTQQNAALVEESAAAAESLSQQAGKLVEAVSVFTLRA